MFFFRRKKEKNILILDIGSSSVNSYVLSKKDNEAPSISSFHKIRLPILEDPDFKHLERHTKKAIKYIAEEFHKKVPKIFPDLIYIAISVPWYFSETKDVKISRRENFKVTHELMEEIIGEEVELFSRKAREKLGPKEDIEIIEKDAMKFVVNGYPISSPYGRETKQLELLLYLSASKKNFINNIEEILRHYFGKIEIKFASEPFPLYSFVSTIIDPKEGFLIVDVGGEVTEVYLIKDRVLASVKSFIWGGNLVIRRIASSLNIGLDEALSLFKVKNAGDVHEDMDEKLTKTAEGVCSQWQNFLAESLSELAKDSPLPQTLVLLGGVAGSDILKKCLNSPEFASFTILGKPFTVVDLLPESLDAKISTALVDRKDSQMTVPLILGVNALNHAGK